MTHRGSESETESEKETSLDKFNAMIKMIESVLNFGKENLIDFDENQRDIRKKLDFYESQCKRFGMKRVSKVMKTIRELPGFENFDLDAYAIGSLQCQIMFETFSMYPPTPLASISLRNNQIEPFCCHSIESFVKISKSLKKLNLEGCKFDDEGADILSGGLSISKSIVQLNLANCHISDKGVAVLVRSLKWNSACRELNLSSNFVGIESAKAFEDTLISNKTLRKLDLSYNALVENDAILEILKGLARNETLEYLDLSWNALCGEAFGKLLIKAVKMSKLKILKMEHNRMSTFELKKLAFGMKRSKTIEEAYVGDNLMFDEEDVILVGVFKSKSPLRLLSFGKWFHLSREAFNLLLEVKVKKPDIQVVYKSVVLPNPPRSVNMFDIFADRAKYLAMKPKNKRMKRDMGVFMVQLNLIEEPFITRDDFLKKLQNFRAKLDDSLVRQYMDAFTDWEKRVHIKSMASHYLNRHPLVRVVVSRNKTS